MGIVVPGSRRRCSGIVPTVSHFEFASAEVSHRGAVRPDNEDRTFAGRFLIAVADGVGGSVYGEVASALAIEAISGLDDRGGDEPAVAGAFDAASTRLAQAAEDNPELQGMATTLVLLALHGDRVVVAHAGDSRAYVLRQGRLEPLTTDDSLVQQLLDAGIVSPDEAAHHPGRFVVLRTVNGDPVEPHVDVVAVEGGERFLVCSDGLTDAVDEGTIARLLGSAPDPAAGCAALLEATLAAGAPDNVSCVIADLRPIS